MAGAITARSQPSPRFARNAAEPMRHRRRRGSPKAGGVVCSSACLARMPQVVHRRNTKRGLRVAALVLIVRQGGALQRVCESRVGCPGGRARPADGSSSVIGRDRPRKSKQARDVCRGPGVHVRLSLPDLTSSAARCHRPGRGLRSGGGTGPARRAQDRSRRPSRPC